MEEKYRIQYLDIDNSSVSIAWVSHLQNGYEKGDCRVRAIKEGTDRLLPNLSPYGTHHNYDSPKYVEEIKMYLQENKNLFGGRVIHCIGLRLEDACTNIDFDEPIRIN